MGWVKDWWWWPWLWFCGQRGRLLLRRSEFESYWSLHLYSVNCVKRMKINKKGWEWPCLKKDWWCLNFAKKEWPNLLSICRTRNGMLHEIYKSQFFAKKVRWTNESIKVSFGLPWPSRPSIVPLNFISRSCSDSNPHLSHSVARASTTEPSPWSVPF